MRVIAGKYKGRSLVSAGKNTRPTLDRTKETLFNILQMKIQNAFVLDLFAGSGQLAIECLSRNCARAIVCDNDKTAQKAIVENFRKIGEAPELFSCSYQDCLKSLQNASVDIIFVDPPYQSNFYCDVLKKIAIWRVLADNGVVICEHSAIDQLPDNVENLTKYDERKIGSVKFSFYKRSEQCQ